MRIPFTKYGIRELVMYAGLAFGLAAFCGIALSFWVSPFLGLPLAGVFFLLGLFVMSFFRDPERKLSGDSLDIISPADGTVTHVVNNDPGTGEYIEGQAHWIGIFLSVFNVHVNRSPLDGEVEYLRYKEGKFLDARHPDCGRLNEQQVIGMKASAAGGARLLVKQISGLIARHIVCPLEPGNRLMRGERFGMIKFGSRTELWIDAKTCDVEWLVKPGQKVKGGLTLIGRVKVKTVPSEAVVQAEVTATPSGPSAS